MSLQSTAGFVYSAQITLESFYENASLTTPMLVRTSQSARRNEGALFVFLLLKLVLL